MAKRIALTSLTITLLCILLAPFIACAPHKVPPFTDPVHIPGYLGLQEEFGNLDFSSLRHRRIVLDPGHGGFFRGAMGPEGLTEAEVNLGVALYLRGLLEWAGAEVHLTRTADYDFLTPADSTLATDLSFRTAFADSLQPDVFVSIHHNSTASRDPEINETQTYYPLGDDGASLDLARSIHRHLVLNLEITPAKILPGNFHVLRKASVPAVLGEPAMISNPVMEGRLSLASSHDLEAKAYFLGLLDYFSAGQPRFSGVDTLRVLPGNPDVNLTKVFNSSTPGDPRGPGPDPSSFHLTLDGVSQGFDLSADGRTVTWRPASTLLPGSALLRLTGRNLKGRATPASNTVIMVGNQPELAVTHSSESPTDNANPRTMLFWHSRSSALPSGGLLSVNGEANLSLPPRSRGWFLLPEKFSGQLQFQHHPQYGAPAVPMVSSSANNLPPGLRWRLISMGEEPIFASSMMPPKGWHHRLPLAPISYENPLVPSGSPAVVWLPGSPIWIEAKGVLPLIHPGSGRDDRASTIDPDTFIWRPRQLLHQLFGKTIILDPAGGGTDNNGTYALGSRGADLNLETARQVRLLLEGAGAQVFVTREGEVAPDSQQKVLLAGDRNADLFLTIARALPGQKPKVQHHPGSRTGERWAKAMTLAMAPMDHLTMETSYAYLLRHTACPALEIQLQAPLNTREEMLFTSLSWHMAEARGILLACATALSGTDDLPPSLDPALLLKQLSIHPEGQSLPSVQWARWDGNFNWVPPSFQDRPDTVVSWQETGWPAISDLHTLEIHAGSQWQVWRVETPADRSKTPQFKLMLENR